VLRVMFPDIEIIGDVSADFPECVKVRQYLGSPSSANKLIHNASKKPERHLEEIRRHILRRWIETGRQSTLVICQQKVERWLKDKLPAVIAIAHFNAISGLDAFKDVRLLVIVGRTIPNPNKVEAIAATLSGGMPKSAEADANGFHWYDRVKRVIRLRDGTGRATYGDQHPDELCESIRWLICEAELIQAIGRGRGINRNPDAPLDIDLLFNEALPIVVDQVLAWEDASALIETALDGVMLTSPIDLMRIWPAMWPNLTRAKRTTAARIPILPGFVAVEYQLAGPKMKRRTGYFDLNLIPDPLKWLEERLGPLTREE
jgi:putative DNA primase/helicase